LDVAVRVAGSRWALLVTVLLLVAWGVWGVVSGPTDTWQVILQDVSSIQAYISATLLMRQQQSSCRGVLNRICSLISRSESNERMLRSLTPEHRAQLKLNKHRLRADILASLQTSEDFLDKFSNWVSAAVGSLIFLGIYWLGIIGWVFSGIPLEFSDTWQLDVNTATALEITLTTMFLQNIRQQHDNRLERCINSIDLIDSEIETELRKMTGNREPNPLVISTPPKHTRATRGLDTYAFIFGGSIGVVISCFVFAAWLAVGEPMEFDDNWFLIIGTYTGLMGFIDGFVMKNVDHREAALTNQHFERLIDQDFKLFRLLDIDMPSTPKPTKRSLNQRISAKIGHVCGSTAASYGSIFATFALIGVASAMQWTETGQLLCNTPTMIFEGFLLITLMQAHNMEDDCRRVVYDDILMRRLVL
ncbi:Low affinity iron permease, partial [Thozetella sp. PMI_491]